MSPSLRGRVGSHLNTMRLCHGELSLSRLANGGLHDSNVGLDGCFGTPVRARTKTTGGGGCCWERMAVEHTNRTGPVLGLCSCRQAWFADLAGHACTVSCSFRQCRSNHRIKTSTMPEQHPLLAGRASCLVTIAMSRSVVSSRLDCEEGWVHTIAKSVTRGGAELSAIPTEN